MTRRLLPGVLAVVLLLWMAPGAGPITGAIPDATDHPAVGAVLVDIGSFDEDVEPGTTYGLVCSGTRLDPTTVLTAAHCLDLVPPGAQLVVTFADQLTEAPPAGAPVVDTDLLEGQLHPVADAQRALRTSPGQNDTADVALLTLADAADGPTLAVDLGWWDARTRQELRTTTFTNVGYGQTGRDGYDGPVARRVSESAFLALRPAFANLSQNPARGHGGTCQGDSGGPVLAPGDGGELVVVAVISQGDPNCRATNVVYRLDTDAARALLAGR